MTEVRKRDFLCGFYIFPLSAVKQDLGRYWDQTTSFIKRAKDEGVAIIVYDFSGVSNRRKRLFIILTIEYV